VAKPSPITKATLRTTLSLSLSYPLSYFILFFRCVYTCQNLIGYDVAINLHVIVHG
jgi:hypothetical protein